MEEPLSTPRRDWPLLMVLLALALAMRVWQVKTTEVAARDSIGYARIAWQLEHHDWRKIIPAAPHHPGYPVAVLVASFVVRRVHPGPLPDVMQYSAQVASSFASILLVLPMFFLGRELFDRRVAFWATLLFQCLPASGRVLADGLSESLFFLFAALALWQAVVAFRRRSPWWFAGVGLFGALAYLTRPEGALIVAATGIVLAAVQVRPATRQSWGNFAASMTALTVAALLLAGPYMILIGNITTTHTGQEISKEAVTNRSNQPDSPMAAVQDPPGSVAQHPVVFAVWWDNRTGDTSHAVDQRRLWALTTLLGELCKLFFYVLWLPLLLGVWVYRDRFRRLAGAWVLAIVSLALLPLLYRVAMKMGYLSDRHALLILCCTVYWIVAGMLWIAERSMGLFRDRRWARPQVSAAILMVLVCAGGLVRTLEPMHSDRAGFREAGYWLAEHAEPGDFIDDPYTWASYYAGRTFVEEPPPHEPGTARCVYVVIEWSNYKQPPIPPASNMEYVFEKGQLIRAWPVHRRRENAQIVLYRVTF
jgi:hypothetical protein